MSDQENLETQQEQTPKEIKRAVKKKFLVKKNLEKEKEFDFSKYGVRRQARIYAMFALYSYDVNKENSKIYDIKDFDFKEMNMNENASAFAHEILEGTIKNIKTVDAIIEKYSEHWDIKRIQYVDKAIIRISIYSLLFQKSVPKSVVIDEAIEIAKIFSGKDSYKFINGILDSIKPDDIKIDSSSGNLKENT